MAVPKEKLLELIKDSGWELVEAREIARLWCAEIWLIRSAWSPTDCEAFLTFEIDPQAGPEDVSSVWAVSPSRSRPEDWTLDGETSGGTEDGHLASGTFPITKEGHLGSLVRALDALRMKKAG